MEINERKPQGHKKSHRNCYQDYAICLVPKCTSCADKFGILIPDTSLDANQVVNLRVLFVASPGWTFFSIDYQNIEVRTAANLSKEPELENIFLLGDGDHHALTASKVFPEYNDPKSKCIGLSLFVPLQKLLTSLSNMAALLTLFTKIW